MWIARDKNGSLMLFRDYPKRNINVNSCDRPVNSIVLYDEDYPQYRTLSWKDDPIEVDLIETSTLNFIEIQNELL